ncbi:Nicotinamide/nicotinic acid mononucleotide adenylyltransferase 2 [Podila minutissima]|uniref:Nicotinamide/nicotinic acid mononucleotide adenylyltransferase 2 n=1 Tax=Podila minutissima TaxID=64525 RepID=A0A9P5VJJ5_9FUNG|nr:Nicotinamide/nicotinic acid mononucleotide adenylyltransferase 2 [Podila minutissima]
MLEAAKKRMEQELGQEEEGAVILGGFLSPSHDLYVGEKLRGEELVLNSRERLDLCRLQTADSDWIDVDAWESNQDRFYDYHKVTSRLQQYLQERCHHVLAEKMNALARTHGSHQQIPQHYRQQYLPQHHYVQQTPLQKMVPQRPGSLDSKNPFNIRVVYLCGADFVLRTGARKLTGGIVVVDRPLGAPSSNRRSILLTNSGGSISVPVSNQLDKSEEEDALSESGSITSESSMSSSTFSTHSSGSSISTKHRVFKRLEQSYGSEWCEASRNNVWWLPARSRTESEDISSTKIRGLLSDRKSCKGLLHPLVALQLQEKQASLRA